jgi:predicted RNase H-like nuclease (RuvC/YqgF family)
MSRAGHHAERRKQIKRQAIELTALRAELAADRQKLILAQAENAQLRGTIERQKAQLQEQRELLVRLQRRIPAPPQVSGILRMGIHL